MATATERLRAAILNDISEDFVVIGELTQFHEDLVDAWNDFALTVGDIPIDLSELEDE